MKDKIALVLLRPNPATCLHRRQGSCVVHEDRGATESEKC